MSRFIPLVALCGLLLLTASTYAQDQIPWITDLREARQLAEQQQKLVLLHFWSESCHPCRELENHVFNRPDLVRLISTAFVPVKINVVQQSRIAEFYRIERIPTDILVDPSGRELFRRTSPATANEYIAMLDQVRAHAMTNPGKAIENLAQSVLPTANSLLPPRTPEAAGNQSFNADPGILAGRPATNSPDNGNLPPWATATPSKGLSPTTIQNQFTAAPSAPPAVQSQGQVAEIGPRYGNPFTQPPAPAASSPSSASLPADAASSRPWEHPSQPALDATSSNLGAPASAPYETSPPLGSDSLTTPSGGSTTNASPSQSSLPALPANIPPLALDGFCPVTLVNLAQVRPAEAWIKGDPRYGAIHRGRTYLMASQPLQQQFLSDPDRFAPALSGYDPVRFAETRQLVDGHREFGVFLDKTYYLFADESSLLKFERQPHAYVNAVRQAMGNASASVSR